MKELNQTALWLQVISKTNLVKPDQIVDILAENTELAKILTASVKTAPIQEEGT